jgi:hypothetical protein
MLRQAAERTAPRGEAVIWQTPFCRRWCGYPLRLYAADMRRLPAAATHAGSAGILPACTIAFQPKCIRRGGRRRVAIKRRARLGRANAGGRCLEARCTYRAGGALPGLARGRTECWARRAGGALAERCAVTGLVHSSTPRLTRAEFDGADARQHTCKNLCLPPEISSRRPSRDVASNGSRGILGGECRSDRPSHRPTRHIRGVPRATSARTEHFAIEGKVFIRAGSVEP